MLVTLVCADDHHVCARDFEIDTMAELTTVDIAEIDAAGLEGAIPWPPKFTRGRRAVVVAAVCFASLVCGYFGFNFV